jgi:hypothetical protein
MLNTFEDNKFFYPTITYAGGFAKGQNEEEWRDQELKKDQNEMIRRPRTESLRNE